MEPGTSKIESLRAEIRRLTKLSSAESIRRDQLRPVQAEALYQDAERRFLLGERQSAMADLRKVLEQYDDTPAAARAREFLRFAQLRSLLEQLEGARIESNHEGLAAALKPDKTRIMPNEA